MTENPADSPEYSQKMAHGDISTGGQLSNGPSTGPDGVIDFTPRRPRVQFRIGDDLFTGKVEIPTMVAMRFAAKASRTVDSMDGEFNDEGIQQTIDLIRMMLVKDSADLLIERLDDDTNPVGMETFMKLVPWLMEQYGMRPTTPSSDSQDGSQNQDGGTNSTESLPLTELTSSPSDSISL